MAILKAIKDGDNMIGPLRPPSFAHAINNPNESYLAPLKKEKKHAVKVTNTTPRPYFNKRGEELLKTQFGGSTLSNKEKESILNKARKGLGEDGGATSSNQKMDVVSLMQLLDSTANRTSKSHDISHLRDTPPVLAPNIPKSMIPKKDWVYEKTFLPKNDQSIYNKSDGLWHTVVFPSRNLNAKSKRSDAIMLDQWISKSLNKQTASHEQEKDASEMLTDIVPILSAAFHEVVRQESQHCPERGAVIDKIWRTYVELFDRTLKDMSNALSVHKERSERAQRALDAAEGDLTDVRKSHPERMQEMIHDTEKKYTGEIHAIERELENQEAENVRLTKGMRESDELVTSWYPHFTAYRSTYLAQGLPTVHQGKSSGTLARAMTFKRSATSSQESSLHTPEGALGEDFKRLLTALPADKRKIVGGEIAESLASYVEGTDTQMLNQQKARLLDEKEEHLIAIKELEEQVEKRKKEIAEAREKAAEEAALRRDSEELDAVALAVRRLTQKNADSEAFRQARRSKRLSVDGDDSSKSSKSDDDNENENENETGDKVGEEEDVAPKELTAPVSPSASARISMAGLKPMQKSRVRRGSFFTDTRKSNVGKKK